MLPARTIVAAVLALFITALPVQSALAAFGITSVAGGIELPGPPPPNVHPGSNEAGLPIVFPEVINGVVTSLGGLPVDHDGSNVVASPTVSGNVVNPALISTTLGAGVGFNSYLFHFDPVGSPFFAFFVTTINFDNPVIGVQLFSNGFQLDKPSGTAYVGTLEGGDAEVAVNGGPPVAYYPGGLSYRGVEEDAFVLAIAGNTVMLAGSVSGVEIDQIRILTVPTIFTEVPEPAAAASWAIISAIGCCGVFFWRRQQKNQLDN